MVKMIVMDLDGTLLTDDKNISDYTLSVLKKCKNNGIKIVLATARSEKSAKRYIELLKPDIMIRGIFFEVRILWRKSFVRSPVS